ncbi:methyltransferase domain-containing protein [Streptomyces xanthochromogenes]|uniref:methyltransferase domain-containing protein n=1 Tax=Streptomyces xanthochromogenes TaxID=67384 RepID=UPI003437C2FD
MGSLSQTGRDLWTRTIPVRGRHADGYPVLSEELRSLFHATAGQGRRTHHPAPRARTAPRTRRVRPHLRLCQTHLEVRGGHPPPRRRHHLRHSGSISPTRPRRARRQASSPASRAVTGHLTGSPGIKSVLDHGCGRGADVAHYRLAGLAAEGFGPHDDFGWPRPERTGFVLVTSMFVLNVLADPWQRIKALKDVASFARPGGHLVISSAHRRRSPRLLRTVTEASITTGSGPASPREPSSAASHRLRSLLWSAMPGSCPPKQPRCCRCPEPAMWF